jgi:hypothetical protein
MFLSDNPDNPLKWRIPDHDPDRTSIAPGGYLLLWLDDEPQEGSNHAPFKLNAAGEHLRLSDSAGNRIDSISFGQQTGDVSLGRLPDGTGPWTLFPSPTPLAPNQSSPTLPRCAAPQASNAGGFYDLALQIQWDCPTPGASIRLSFDGSVPEESDSLYTQPIDIQHNTVLRARAFAPGHLPSTPTTHSYFFNTAHTFPLVSLVFEPADFFDSLSGIYTNAELLHAVEVPVHAEWFEPDGSTGFRGGLAAEMFGSGSLGLPQKSILLKAKPAFGLQEIEYRIFPDLARERYRRLVLRNSGQDWGLTMFRDACVSDLGRTDADLSPMLGPGTLDFQGFRPTVLYLNGQYWGIHNAREQLDAEFVAQHAGIPEGDLDLIEFYGHALAGDSLAWQAFWDWLQANPAHGDSAFQYLAQRNDLRNFADYCIFQIISDNVDWPSKNWRRYRQRSTDSHWRWLPYDFDLSFGLMNLDFSWNTGFAGQNAFLRAMDSSFTYWSAAPWQTIVLRRCLENQPFRHFFLNRSADLLNTMFRSNRVLGRINAFEALYLPEIERHFERWFLSPGWTAYWQGNVQKMRDFAQLRPAFCFEHAVQCFPEATGTADVLLHVEPPGSGSLRWSTLRLDSLQLPWAGTYFSGIPIPLQALAKPGWRFAGWSSEALHFSDSTQLTLDGSLELTAYFVPDSMPSQTPGNDVAAAPALRVFPNPAGQWLQVRTAQPIGRCDLYNSLGIKQKSWIFKPGADSGARLDLSDCPPGAYFLQAFGTEGQRIGAEAFFK